MGHPGEKRQRATYADVEAVPRSKVAELVGGVLHVLPRPALRHATTRSVLGIEIGGPFQRRRGGPGGWWILDEPELHFHDPGSPGDVDVPVPDLAGWRRERMPEVPDAAYCTLTPDWICEVVSPSTATFDLRSTAVRLSPSESPAMARFSSNAAPIFSQNRKHIHRHDSRVSSRARDAMESKA